MVTFDYTLRKGKTMNHEIHLDLDPASDQFKELQDAYLNDKTYTIERGGVTYTGCRITSIRLEGPGNDVRGYVTLTAPFNSALPEIVSTPEGRNAYRDLSEQDYSKVEARTLAWLDDNQQFGGDPFDPDAKSFYDGRIRDPFAYMNAKSDDRIPAGVITGRLTGKAARLASQEIHRKIDKQLRLGASYPHKMEYAKGGPWTRPGVGFYPHEKFRFEELEMKNWKFKSVHPKDIDFDELCESVTRQNPLAIVKGTYTERVKHPTATRNPAGEIIMRNIWDETLDANRAGAVQTVNAEFPGVIFLKDPVPVMGFTLKPVEREENYVVVHRSLYDKSLVAAIDLPTALAPKLANAVGARVYTAVKTAEFRNWIAWAKEVKAAKWDDGRKATFEVDLPTI